MIGTRMGIRAGGNSPDPPEVVCQQHPRFVMGGGVVGESKAVRRCPSCWAVFHATCMGCVHLDELRSRMTGSACDGCESSSVHQDYGPNSEGYDTRDLHYDPRRDGVVQPKRNWKREIRMTYGVPFPPEM